jgi:hypothetical protein
MVIRGPPFPEQLRPRCRPLLQMTGGEVSSSPPAFSLIWYQLSKSWCVACQIRDVCCAQNRDECDFKFAIFLHFWYMGALKFVLCPMNFAMRKINLAMWAFSKFRDVLFYLQNEQHNLELYICNMITFGASPIFHLTTPEFELENSFGTENSRRRSP